MITGFITLATTLLGLVFWAWKRRAARKDDPLEQHRYRYATIDKDIAKGDSQATTAHASADLDELERLLHSKGH